MPSRIQRSRNKGWRKPEGAVYVGRGTPFGNPWAVVRTNTGTGWAVQWAGHANQHRPLGLKDFVPANDKRDAHVLAVELYEMWVHSHPTLLERIRRDLAGRDLMCWCSLPEPGEPDHCHAAVLLDLANGDTR